MGGQLRGGIAARDGAGTLSSNDVVAALLFREILKPLAHGLGPVGDVVLGTVADDLALRRPR